MRPARKGPENDYFGISPCGGRRGFNEAGPQGAGKPASPRRAFAGGGARFNEAGPQGAGKHRRFRGVPPILGHASMRPARKGPENGAMRVMPRLVISASMRPARKGPENVVQGQKSCRLSCASMRPARKGPENIVAMSSAARGLRGFNEAGPQGAGKHEYLLHRRPHGGDASMRPARKGPENRSSWAAPRCRKPLASMRPARKGPENDGRPACVGISVSLQ